MTDQELEATRQALTEEVNAEVAARTTLEAKHGQVWNTVQMQADFQVLSFAAPFVIVKRRADNQLGTLTFQHRPRLYFQFIPD